MGYFNRRRANSVVIPDISLNSLKLCSGVAEMILSGQFDDDISWYMTHFNAFLTAHLMNDIKDKVTRDGYDGFDATSEVINKYSKYAVARGTKNNPEGANSFATLMHAEELNGETGAIVQNAIIYSLAMSIATEAKTPQMKEVIQGISMIRGASNTKTPEEYRADTLSQQPRASAIAETLAHLESKKVAHNVVAMMGYLIDKGDIGASETERQKVERIFDEQAIDMPDFTSAFKI